jgi:predicted AAA+ superfamily ATPase
MLAEHLASHRQMAFFTGPRQVGKTTTCGQVADWQLNWDDEADRILILSGTREVEAQVGLEDLQKDSKTILFDELHKYPRWKQFLKGFFDKNADRCRVIVTGSSRLDTYQRVGDSLMGRYLLYRIHPFSVAETLNTVLPDVKKILRDPKSVDEDAFEALWEYGGYPDPFLKRDRRFSLRWQQLRQKQLIQEDLRDLTQIQQLDQLSILAKLLQHRSGHQLVYSNLAKEVRVSVDTIRRWVDTLVNLHHGFLVRPWHKNVSRSLRKEPKWFARDWAVIEDTGSRSETFVACHLLKAVDGWNDLGLGIFELGYLRDTEKREVDFVVVRDGSPWFLVEVKHAKSRMSEALSHFQGQTGAPYAFQAVITEPYVDADPFDHPGRPVRVPARTLLSQLL